MDEIELKVNRLNTKAFIAAKPVTLKLLRAAEVRTPSGATRKGAAAPINDQVFRIIEQGSPSAPQQIVTVDGTARNVSFMLLGLHDADVKKGDTWREGDRDWEVGDLVRPNGYETRALVVESGG